MARVKLPFTIIDLGGNAVAGASVLVQDRSSGTSAPLYSTETGATTVNNPATSNGQGRVEAWVNRGSYVARISGTGLADYEENFEAAPGGDRSIDTVWLPTGAFAERVLTMPTTPSDGQVVCYVGSGAPPGGWYFRYNSSSTSPYKWEAVGQQLEIYRENGGTLATSITAPAAGTLNIHLTAGGLITPTLTGEYAVRYHLVAQLTSAGTGLVVTGNVGRFTTNDTTSVSIASPFITFQNVNDYYTLSGFHPAAVLTSGQQYVLKTSHGNTSSWVTYYRSLFAVAPVRVQG